MDIYDILRQNGQGRLASYLIRLDPELRGKLIRQLRRVDWQTVALWKAPEDLSGKDVSPVEGLSLSDIAAKRDEYFEIGKRAIREGKVGAILLAGGQGTRLGSSSPKGMYDIGVTKSLTIFEQLFENLKKTSRLVGAPVPIFIMASEVNYNVSANYLRRKNFFGYPGEYVKLFRQKSFPCVDFEGNLLLANENSLTYAPNGNGGWYASLLRAWRRHGALKGIEWYNVFGVDNVLQKIADPVFVGATIASGSACGAKVVKKTDPDEKVGLLCRSEGKPAVVEYYEMPKERAALRDESGELAYRWGVILNYLFRADKLEEISSQKIPVHVVKKKVPFFDGERVVTPETENGYKFETLILDMVKLMGSCLPFEVAREKEFAPIKNLTGADSVESARRLLRQNGVEI